MIQLIGLVVIHSDPFTIQKKLQNGTIESINNPVLSIIQPPHPETARDFTTLFVNLVIAFAIAVTFILVFSHYKFKFLIKLWFFIVVIMAMFISFLAFSKQIFGLNLVDYLAPIALVLLALSIFLAIFKVYKPNIIVHNFTELLIYPGIAVIFVPILSQLTIIILLVIISLYDMWAVWHTGMMQKMAKFQMNELQIFGGLLIPYMSKKIKAQIKKFRIQKQKLKKLKNKRFKISLAILGGGDLVFPLIAAGVFLKAVGLSAALIITVGAFLGLAFLFWRSEKGKSYPAMPFITAGIFIAIIVSKLTGIIPYIIPGIF